MSEKKQEGGKGKQRREYRRPFGRSAPAGFCEQFPDACAEAASCRRSPYIGQDIVHIKIAETGQVLDAFDADGNRRCAQHGLPEGKPAPAEAKQDPKRKHQHKIGDDPPENKGMLFIPRPAKRAEQGNPRHPFRFRLPSEKGHGEQEGKIDEKKGDPARAKQESIYSVRGNRMFHFL